MAGATANTRAESSFANRPGPESPFRPDCRRGLRSDPRIQPYSREGLLMLAPPKKRKPASEATETGSALQSKRGRLDCENNNQRTAKTQRESPQAAWRKRNPKAAWAHSCLQSALRRGLIEKEPCEVCGSVDVDGHHDNYDEPGKVRWLCRKHHKAHHKAERKRRKGGAHG